MVLLDPQIDRSVPRPNVQEQALCGVGQGLFLVDGRGVEAYDDFVLEPPREVDSWFRGRILGRVAAEDDADGAVADPSEEREDGGAGSESRRVGAMVCGCGCGCGCGDEDREGDEDYRRARQ